MTPGSRDLKKQKPKSCRIFGRALEGKVETMHKPCERRSLLTVLQHAITEHHAISAQHSTADIAHPNGFLSHFNARFPGACTLRFVNFRKVLLPIHNNSSHDRCQRRHLQRHTCSLLSAKLRNVPRKHTHTANAQAPGVLRNLVRWACDCWSETAFRLTYDLCYKYPALTASGSEA